MQADRETLLRANRAFYEAFEARDLGVMSDLWEHSERVSCTHPGWPPLHGWAKVISSWFSLFQGPQQLQFILTGERVEVVGDVGWVSVEENILDVGQSGTVAALNIFVRAAEGWRLVAHHGSAVTG